MKLDEQCCTLEQAKELRELGVKQDSLFYHFPNPNLPSIKKKYKLSDYNVRYGKEQIGKETHSIKTLVLQGAFQSTYSAFTVAELCVMLGDNFPTWSFKYRGKTKWIATIQIKKAKRSYDTVLTAPEFDRYAETQAQALATLLIATIKTGYLKVKDINKRLL